MLNRDFVRSVLKLIELTTDVNVRACVRAILVDLSRELSFTGIIRQIQWTESFALLIKDR